MIPADVAFLLLAGIAFLGFILDALFDRLRIASVLPLMLLGVLLLNLHVLPPTTISALSGLIPYVSAVAVAFILFAVGLEIRYSELSEVFGRATLFTLAVQATTGVLLSLLAFEVVHWSLYVSFIFGFALSGPSSIAVPVLVRVARMPKTLRTSLLYESVITDVLQLLVPLIMLGLLVSGNFSTTQVTSTLLWTILGSAAAGVAGGVGWLWILDRLRDFTRGYTWTLTITMVLATYGVSARIGLSPAITIFIFGLLLGNATLFDASSSAGSRAVGGLRGHLSDLRERIGLSTGGLDIPHILQVQKEVSFFASAFFFVYIGLLFNVGGVSWSLFALTLIAALTMLAVRYAFTPLLSVYMDPAHEERRSQRGLVAFNISRGLASAVIATVPAGLGIFIPGFLDAIFLGILLSTVVSTLGVFLVYRPATPLPPSEAGEGLSMATLAGDWPAPASESAPTRPTSSFTPATGRVVENEPDRPPLPVSRKYP